MDVGHLSMYMCMQHTNFEGEKDSHEGGKIPEPSWPYVEKTLFMYTMTIQLHVHVASLL